MPRDGMPPIHPGEVLREDYLRELDMSVNALAKALKVPTPRINDVVLERRGVSADTALRLARYFDTTPEFWLNMQSNYDLKVAQDKVGDTISREVVPRSSSQAPDLRSPKPKAPDST